MKLCDRHNIRTRKQSTHSHLSISDDLGSYLSILHITCLNMVSSFLLTIFQFNVMNKSHETWRCQLLAN